MRHRTGSPRHPYSGTPRQCPAPSTSRTGPLLVIPILGTHPNKDPPYCTFLKTFPYPWPRSPRTGNLLFFNFKTVLSAKLVKIWTSDCVLRGKVNQDTKTTFIGEMQNPVLYLPTLPHEDPPIPGPLSIDLAVPGPTLRPSCTPP